jgi:HTH-type transcriptional regulator, competence development regulator
MSKLKNRSTKLIVQPETLGATFRRLREARELPLREVAEAADMDLALLHKIEAGQRAPTEDQTAALAKFFKLDVIDTQARRIAERFRLDYADDPASFAAISILAEEAAPFRVTKRTNR